MQPVRTNTDPLNIILGNPNLKPSFTNNFDLSYQLNNISTNFSAYLQAVYAFTTNYIGSAITTDISSGRSTFQYNNISDKASYNYSLFADLNRRAGSTGINWGLTLSSKGNIFYNLINGVSNKVSAYSYTLSANLSKSKKNHYNLSAFAGPTYNINQFSTQPFNSNNAIGFNSSVLTRLFLPAKFQISSDIRYSYVAGTQAFDARKRTLWNIILSKTALREDNLKFSVMVNDLLNQNLIFNRTINTNLITQSASTSIKRYFMLSVSWDFNKFGTSPIKI